MSPKATFVIPARNAEAWLSETLDSVRRQTYRDISAIVVDDGSTDDTPALAEFHAKQDARIRLRRLDQPVGRSDARNLGNREADGDVILVLDADDVALPNRAEETVRFFEQNPDKGVFYSAFVACDALGGNQVFQEARPLDMEEVKRTLLFGIGHSTVAYRREVAAQIPYTNGPFADLAIDDWKFYLDAVKAGCLFGMSTKALAMYRVIPKKRDEKRIEELKRSCLPN
jgi:glycosyltransferase involved in cell wall biosynthesis